jgi:hypothetical protein
LGCLKSAQTGGTQNCKAHGGGKRCQLEGCTKSARGDTEHCVSHGGVRRCQHAGCPTVSCMGEASAASRRAAPSQPLEVPAVCTASNACRASSPTMRRRPHRNSLTRHRRPKTRVASRSELHGGVRRLRAPTASAASDVYAQCACVIEARMYSSHRRTSSSRARQRTLTPAVASKVCRAIVQRVHHLALLLLPPLPLFPFSLPPPKPVFACSRKSEREGEKRVCETQRK